MSVKSLLLPVVAASLVFTGSALADGGPVAEPPPPPAPAAFERSVYIEAEGGIAFASDLFWSPPAGFGATWVMDTGYNVGGAFGVHLSPNWDVEIEGFYANVGYEVSDSNISGLSAMVNVLYNFDTGWGIDPYLGAGLGATRVYYDRQIAPVGWSGGDWGFGYQVMGGVMMHVSPSLGIFVEYRFHDVTSDAEIPSGVIAEYQTHNVSGGVQFTF